MDSWPVDVLLAVVVHLPVQSVLALRCTCKTLHDLTRLRALWVVLFRTHVLEQCIPCPNRPIAALDASELEALVHRALALRRTWTSPSPVPRNRFTLVSPEDCGMRTIFLQFLPARENRWLISVRMSARPRTYLLQCWDVLDQPRCIAALTHADGPYGGVVLNSDPTSTAVLAMQSAQTETFSIDFDADDPECAFQTEATIDGIRELHLLAGSTLVTRQSGDAGPISLWDLADLPREKIQLHSPSLVPPDDRIHAVHVAHDFALVVRTQAIETYSTLGGPIAYPLVQQKLQWRADTAVLCPLHMPASPIALCVRFGSIYPWPVNVLHHYILTPNPGFSPPTTQFNLPYDPLPVPTHTIGSPVRLFGQSAMALGPYGTALWLDNHTEEWMGPSERGQRLAGRVIIAADQQPTTETVFGVQGDEAWTRVAMEEEAGLIALGHHDGPITLLQY